MIMSTITAKLICPHCGRSESAECDYTLLPYKDSGSCIGCGNMFFESWSEQDNVVTLETYVSAYVA